MNADYVVCQRRVLARIIRLLRHRVLIALLLAVGAGLSLMIRFETATAQIVMPNPTATQPGQGGGQRIVLPVFRSGAGTAPGYSRKSGLQISADLTWPGDYGYKPVFFDFSVANPATAAQQIVVQFSAGNWMTEGRSITIEGDGELEVGQTSTRIDLLVPKYVDWQIARWDVWVDGVKDDSLSFFGGGVVGISNDSLAALIVDQAASQRAQQTIGGLRQMMEGMQISTRVVDFAELPTDWLAYSTLDVVIMSAAKYDVLLERNPPAARAIKTWVLSGGNLWLVDVGPVWEKLGAVHAALDLAEAPVESEESLEPTDFGWIYPILLEREKQPVEGAISLWNLETSYASGKPPVGDANARPAPSLGQTAIEGDATSGEQPPNPPTSRTWFAVRSMGNGVVTIFRDDIRYERQDRGGRNRAAASLNAVGKTLLQTRLNWEMRHGNVPNLENSNFNNMLIPGVGLAPVGLFQLLITLFVIGIGPVNYYVLRRRKKLPMLLITVPAAAAVATALLFAYGLMTDGFDVRVRGRSFTALDQRTGDMAATARLTYYAGMAPTDGLTFPRDMAVYPIHSPGSLRSFGRRGDMSERSFAWNDGQHLQTGWLSSRRTTQFLVFHPKKLDKRLQIAADGDDLSVENKLDVPLTHLAVQDEDGNFYWTTDLNANASQTLSTTTRDAVFKSLREVMVDNELEFPPGAQPRGRGYGSYEMGLSYGLLESQLSAVYSQVVRELGPRVYVAISKKAVELDLGLTDIEEEAGFHVTRGAW